MPTYKVIYPLSVPEVGDPRHADLSLSEYRKCGYRTIGGDKGDIVFNGFYVNEGKSFLYEPNLKTTIEGLSFAEVRDIAQEILDHSYESIGIEALY